MKGGKRYEIGRRSGLLLCRVFAASGCGGGGGSSTPGGGTPPTSTPSPNPSANVAGTVVDEQSNASLAAVQIALAPLDPSATPFPVATTNGVGQFSFSYVPGSYILHIGSDSPTDTHATLHIGITLVGGSNTLTLPIPSPVPNVTYTSPQTNGNLRLMSLSATQQDCLTGANSGRGGSTGLPLLVPDELLEEDAAAGLQEEIAQSTDTPAPMFHNPAIFGTWTGLTTSVNFASCDAWTGTGYSYVNGDPPYLFATNASNIWYGGDWQSIGGGDSYGWQIWDSEIATADALDKLRTQFVTKHTS